MSTRRLFAHLLTVVVVFFIIILLGTAIFAQIEDLNYVDSFYFNVMTSTTIGYGDISPTTDSGKIFVSFYSIISVIVFFYMFAVVLGTTVGEVNTMYGSD